MHAQVTRQPAGHFIADLQSSNGVTLNGSRLNAPAQLFAGDIVALGDCLLRCEEVAALTQSAPSGTPAAADGAQAAASPADANSAATVAVSPNGAPSFHLRIAPAWSARSMRSQSRPRLAPPRLAPTPLPRETPHD